MPRTKNRLRVLFSEGSSNSARQVLYGLGSRCLIDLLDPSALCQCRFSRYVGRRIGCPSMGKSPLDYARFVVQHVKQNRYDVLFPTHEQVYVFSRFRDQLKRSVGLAVPEFDVIRRIQNKAGFSEVMIELDLPTPATQVVYSLEEIKAYQQFPCFIKVVHSTASLGVVRVDNEKQMAETVARFQRGGTWKPGLPIVLQQPAPGRQAEVTAVFQDGRMVGVSNADVLATGIGGGPAMRRTAIHQPVIEHVRRLGSSLQWHGALTLEYFFDETTQQPYYIEANPRICETFNAQAGGVNLSQALLEVSMGQRVDPLPPVKPGVLTHNGFIVMIAAAYNGATRRQLAGRLVRHWFRRDHAQSEMTRARDDWMSMIPATSVIGLLLVAPRSAHGLAHGTVENYSLPHLAAQQIDELTEVQIGELLA